MVLLNAGKIRQSSGNQKIKLADGTVFEGKTKEAKEMFKIGGQKKDS